MDSLDELQRRLQSKEFSDYLYSIYGQSLSSVLSDSDSFSFTFRDGYRLRYLYFPIFLGTCLSFEADERDQYCIEAEGEIFHIKHLTTPQKNSWELSYGKIETVSTVSYKEDPSMTTQDLAQFIQSLQGLVTLPATGQLGLLSVRKRFVLALIDHARTKNLETLIQQGMQVVCKADDQLLQSIVIISPQLGAFLFSYETLLRLGRVNLHVDTKSVIRKDGENCIKFSILVEGRHLA